MFFWSIGYHSIKNIWTFSSKRGDMLYCLRICLPLELNLVTSSHFRWAPLPVHLQPTCTCMASNRKLDMYTLPQPDKLNELPHLIIGSGAFVSNLLTHSLWKVSKTLILWLLSRLPGVVIAASPPLWVNISVKGQAPLSSYNPLTGVTNTATAGGGGKDRRLWVGSRCSGCGLWWISKTRTGRWRSREQLWEK